MQARSRRATAPPRHGEATTTPRKIHGPLLALHRRRRTQLLRRRLLDSRHRLLVALLPSPLSSSSNDNRPATLVPSLQPVLHRRQTRTEMAPLMAALVQDQEHLRTGSAVCRHQQLHNHSIMHTLRPAPTALRSALPTLSHHQLNRNNLNHPLRRVLQLKPKAPNLELSRLASAPRTINPPHKALPVSSRTRHLPSSLTNLPDSPHTPPPTTTPLLHASLHQVTLFPPRTTPCRHTRLSLA